MSKIEHAHPNRKHGESQWVTGKASKEYRTWMHIRNRCNNPKDKGYHRYGGRGIKVCDRWMESYQNFLEDVGRAPIGGNRVYSLDRKDNNGNYEPGNVRWATQSEQQNNRNDTHRIEYRGKTMSMKQWCKELEIPYKTTWSRIQVLGWSVDKAFSYSSKPMS